MYIVYWLINNQGDKTYVGYSGNLNQRLSKHSKGEVVSTKSFGKFSCFILDLIDSKAEAKKREKYWKSRAGRKKLRILYKKFN